MNEVEDSHGVDTLSSIIGELKYQIADLSRLLLALGEQRLRINNNLAIHEQWGSVASMHTGHFGRKPYYTTCNSKLLSVY